MRPAPHARNLFASALALLFAGLTPTSASHAAEDRYYDAAFRAELQPGSTTMLVTLTLTGERLPSRIEFRIDRERQRNFKSEQKPTLAGDVVTWSPTGTAPRISYEFVVNHERSPQRFDSLATKDWAVFRGDKLVPRMTVTSRRSLKGRTTLAFALPQGWSVAAPYPQEGPAFRIEDTDRRLDRPEGWIIAGKLGKRSEIIEGVQTIVAAPEGESARRQDVLAFLNWNLPHLKDVFPHMPKRILIVSAGDPMWRGALSAPNSLFLHADRPLISENRTSTLLHELVHVAMGIRGDEESDWIVEGLAEFYSLEILERSGGIGRGRYESALERMRDWAKRSPNVFSPKSTGASTARAAVAFHAADLEIKQATGGRASIDDVAAELAKRGGEVTVELLQTTARNVAGKDVQALSRQRLMAPP